MTCFLYHALFQSHHFLQVVSTLSRPKKFVEFTGVAAMNTALCDLLALLAETVISELMTEQVGAFSQPEPSADMSKATDEVQNLKV
jgi:hypothetical protein